MKEHGMNSELRDKVIEIITDVYDRQAQICESADEIIDLVEAALTQQQEAEPVDDGAMFDWIDARARETFSRHKSGARGQQITAADNPESHLIWAALAWARLHPPKPAAQPQVPEGYRLIPAHVLEVAEDVVRFVSSFTEFNGYTSEELATVASALLAAKEEGK